MPTIALERTTEEQKAIPPEFPRYFVPRGGVIMVNKSDEAQSCLVIRHDDPGSAIYYELPRRSWERCPCGKCSFDDTWRITVAGYLTEITPSEALLLVGSAQ